MQLYLPIADLPVNVFLILAMGTAVGFVSGMFGIGGGFLMTPLLIFVGIAPAVAVASVASHIAASSFSGALSYWRRRAIDQVEDGWEKTLTGVLKEIYQLWDKYFRPRGYKLRVQIVDFPGGMPGDVGMTLSWG